MSAIFRNARGRFALAAAAALGAAVESGAAPKKLDLHEGWVFKVGDDAGWAATELDDSGWRPIRAGVEWEKEGFPDLDGYAWYRLKTAVPRKWGGSRETRDFGWLVLDLGAVDDVDETFFNGEKIGSTGAFPPGYSGEWNRPRAYRVPAEKIQWGGVNTIAVRVYDGNGKGGIYPGPVSLRLAGPADAVKAMFEPGTDDGIFPAGEPLEVTFRVENEARMDAGGILECEWRPDRPKDRSVLKEERSRITVKGGSRASRSFTFSPPGPGFYPVKVRLKLKGGGVKEDFLVPGSDPGSIRGPLTKEEDFDRFWQARLRELAEVEPGYRLEKVPERSAEDVDTFLVEMRGYRGIRIRGWFTVPKGKGPLPAMLSVAGYGGDMQPAVWRKNVAVLALNIRGQGNSTQDLTPEDEYMYTGLTREPADYVYVGAYLDCVRGIDFLTSRPEVDPERIGMEGESQGGGMTLAACALDPRIRAATADVPWLCDWPDYAETAWWAIENLPKLMRGRRDLGRERILSVLSYVDVMNLADRIECPVMVSMGLRDATCPPRTIMSMYNRIRSEKYIRYYPYGDHWGGGTVHWKIKDEWIMEKLDVKNREQ